MKPTANRWSRVLSSVFLELLAPGLGHIRNGDFWWGLLDAMAVLVMVGGLFLHAGKSYALFVSVLVVLVLWRLTHVALVCIRAWRSGISTFPWLRSVPVLVLASFALFEVLAAGVSRGFVPIRYRLFRLPSGSMEPTVLPGDRFLIDSSWYRHEALERGDVVAVENPQSPGEILLKRCVAIPGDRVECFGDQVLVNGKLMSFAVERKVPGASTKACEGAYMGPLLLEKDEFYCLGDNRANSLDSRIFGPISLDSLKGKALFLLVHKGWIAGSNKL